MMITPEKQQKPEKPLDSGEASIQQTTPPAPPGRHLPHRIPSMVQPRPARGQARAVEAGKRKKRRQTRRWRDGLAPGNRLQPSARVRRVLEARAGYWAQSVRQSKHLLPGGRRRPLLHYVTSAQSGHRTARPAGVACARLLAALRPPGPGCSGLARWH